MKLETPINPNYCATVVEIKNMTPLENCDNVVSTTIQGFKVIVSKETQVGDIGLFFPPETQLSDIYLKTNNLYRHSDLNLDKGQKGYMDDNGRIRAIKFRGNTSQGLFMPLHSLSYYNVDASDLQVGDEFDKINGVQVCNKYVIYTPELKNAQRAEKKKSRVDAIHLPEHITTDQFYKVSEHLPKHTKITVTQKLHGTSLRIGRTYVLRKYTWLEKFLVLIGIAEYE